MMERDCQLKALSLINFKNYEQANFVFCPKINCLVGYNGAGKTNVLDAIYYLSMTKSSLNPADTQNIRYQADFFAIQGEYMRKGAPESVYCVMKRGQKKVFRRNKKEYERLSEHIGLLPVITISPVDVKLITGGSEERRRLINEALSQHNHNYLHDMMQYNRVLEQRNALLKKNAIDNRFNAEVLDILNEQLVVTGNKIYQYRKDFCNELIPIFQKYYHEISGGGEKVELIYGSQLHDNDFGVLLNESIEKDRLLQFTTVGVHKDDLLLHMNGLPIKKSASQGQQKTFLVSLKLANFDFISQHANIAPVLLLDDIFDKFDSLRVGHVIRLVSGEQFGQIFITDTDGKRIEEILRQTNSVYQLYNI